MKAGFRSNNLDPNARHCMASAVTGFMRTFGIDEPMGCYDDIEQADAFVLWGSNMAEMHPILWTRITDRRLTKTDTQVHVLSTFEHRSFELADNGMIFAADRPGDPQLHLQPHHPEQGQPGVRQGPRQLQRASPTSATACVPNHALEKDAKFNGYPAPTASPRATPTTPSRPPSKSSRSSSPPTP